MTDRNASCHWPIGLRASRRGRARDARRPMGRRAQRNPSAHLLLIQLPNETKYLQWESCSSGVNCQQTSNAIGLTRAIKKKNIIKGFGGKSDDLDSRWTIEREFASVPVRFFLGGQALRRRKRKLSKATDFGDFVAHHRWMGRRGVYTKWENTHKRSVGGAVS